MADTRRTLAALQALLADNTSGDISAQDVRDFLVSAIGANVLQTGVLASLPAADQLAGDLYLPTDAPYLLRWNGSAWRPYGLLWPMTLLVDGDYSWVNQGSATLSVANGLAVLHNDANVNNGSWKLRVKTAPATPYTITVGFTVTGLYDNLAAGLCWRQSSDGKLIMVNKTTASATVFATKWDSVSVAGADYNSWSTLLLMSRGVIWFRLADNGTNRLISFSTDGFTWQQLHSVSRTDFLTADQVGFGVFGNATGEQNISIVSWAEA